MNINNYYQIKTQNFADNARTRKIYGEFVAANRPIILSDGYETSASIIKTALENLKELDFASSDIKKVQRYGARIAFRTGAEALQYARDNKIPIVFGQVDQPDVHAQWINDKRIIIINERYKNTTDAAEIFAISAAILHELSHAKDKDGYSSIQEEIDCLAMNALAFQIYRKKYPQLFKNNSAPIIQDGVALYSDLFLGDNAKALENRIKLKYGHLQAGSPNHEPQNFALKIAQGK